MNNAGCVDPKTGAAPLKIVTILTEGGRVAYLVPDEKYGPSILDMVHVR